MDVKVSKLSTPVQCSNEEELKPASSLDVTSMLYSRDSLADKLNQIQSLNPSSHLSDDSQTDNLKSVQKNKTYIQDIHDVEITNEKAVVEVRDKNEDETELKMTHQTASALSAEENSM